MTQQNSQTVAQAPSSTPLHFCHPGQLSKEQMSAIKEFVEQVGGVDNARQALAALLKLEQAA